MSSWSRHVDTRVHLSLQMTLEVFCLFHSNINLHKTAVACAVTFPLQHAHSHMRACHLPPPCRHAHGHKRCGQSQQQRRPSPGGVGVLCRHCRHTQERQYSHSQSHLVENSNENEGREKGDGTHNVANESFSKRLGNVVTVMNRDVPCQNRHVTAFCIKC